MTLFCSTLILANCGLTCDQAVGLSFLFGKRPLTFSEKRSPDSRFFLVRIETTRCLVTESYSRDRGKQNGPIVTLFSFIIIIVVFKSRKDVLKLLLSRGNFLRVFHLLSGFDKIVRVILLTSFSYFPIYL